MSNNTEDKDIYAFHPGEYMNDLIKEHRLTQEEFAKQLGTTPERINKLVQGEVNLSEDLARKLSEFTGTSVELWLNLQKEYDHIKRNGLE